MEYIQRDLYLQRLIDSKDNQEIKIITGSRRSGKSWLLSHIYYDYLIAQGVPEQNIIHISFDIDDENTQDELATPKALKDYLYKRIADPSQAYYVMLDEVQEVEGFEKIVNGLNAKSNVDVYITGSNSHFLSSDINTLFRGRGEEIHIYPLSFKEFCSNRTEPIASLWKEYYTYGGLPGILHFSQPEKKINYLQRLWKKTYLADVKDRHSIQNTEALEALADELCSSIGSLTNAHKLANTIHSVMHIKVNNETIATYLQYLEDAFLFEGTKRYNIKGKRYFESIKKYYCCDVGLRNARLNYRQQEITHIMENIIYNELKIRGFVVDVGVIEIREKQNNALSQVQYEVDFIATNGLQKYYIQSAYHLDSKEKKEQELKSLRKIDDSFQKIVIVGDDIAPYSDEEGITYMGIFHFLLNAPI